MSKCPLVLVWKSDFCAPVAVSIITLTITRTHIPHTGQTLKHAFGCKHRNALHLVIRACTASTARAVDTDTVAFLLLLQLPCSPDSVGLDEGLLNGK